MKRGRESLQPHQKSVWRKGNERVRKAREKDKRVSRCFSSSPKCHKWMRCVRVCVRMNVCDMHWIFTIHAQLQVHSLFFHFAVSCVLWICMRDDLPFSHMLPDCISISSTFLIIFPFWCFYSLAFALSWPLTSLQIRHCSVDSIECNSRNLE